MSEDGLRMAGYAFIVIVTTVIIALMVTASDTSEHKIGAFQNVVAPIKPTAV